MVRWSQAELKVDRLTTELTALEQKVSGQRTLHEQLVRETEAAQKRLSDLTVAAEEARRDASTEQARRSNAEVRVCAYGVVPSAVPWGRVVPALARLCRAACVCGA